ncbi:MAG: YoaK family protein [Acutalibacteraceae bacterium]
MAQRLSQCLYLSRAGSFANMHTGNMSKLGISLAGGNFAGSWQYLAPILAALLGVMFSELVRHRFSGIAFGSWQKNMLAFEILVLVGAAFIASGWHDMLIACVFSFVTEAQLSVFGKWEGKCYSTTICTGNLRNLGQYLYPAIAVHDRESLRTAGLYFVMVFSFALGAVLGIWACAPLGTFGHFPPPWALGRCWVPSCRKNTPGPDLLNTQTALCHMAGRRFCMVNLVWADIKILCVFKNSIEKQPGYGIMALASRFRALIG